MRRIVFIVTGLLQAALGLWLETTTVPKVVVMAQIKGWLPGARPAVVRVADKWHSSYGGRDAYWISWGEGDVRIPGNHRIALREREWRGTQIGDQLEVIYAGTGPFNVYRRGGVFTEPGNFVFDGVLLLNETLLVWFGVRRLIRGIRHAAPNVDRTTAGVQAQSRRDRRL